MKKLLIGLLVVLAIAGCKTPARADDLTIVTTIKELTVIEEPLTISDTLKKLPILKQGIAYSILDNNFSYLSTLELAKWKGFTLEAGYSSKDKIVGVISYQLLKLKDIIDLPILNLVEFNIGLYAGYGRLNIQQLDTAEYDAGISATLVSVKF